jgi:diguanylate cyclase (GGDEF)-like protein
VILVLAVVPLGFGSAAVTAVLFPVGQLDLRRFGLLAACALIHLEATRGIERKRKTAWSGKAPHLDLRSIWSFSALLLLPPALATAIALLTATHVWLRVRPGGKRRPPHRVIYSAAALLIANHAATAVLLVAPGRFPGLPAGMTGVALIAAAALIRWFINYMLVVGVIMLDNPHANAGSALGPLSMQALDAGAMAMAVAVVAVIQDRWELLLILLVGFVVFHRCVLLVQFQNDARTDDKTGLLNSGAWTEDVKRELGRVRRTNSTLGVLTIDIDHFKTINDTHGHPAGDIVVRAVAKALKSEIRAYDYAGRSGGDEFVIAVPDISGADLYSMGKRLRTHIGGLNITIPHSPTGATINVTVSIGTVLYPHTIASDNGTPPDGDVGTADELAAILDELVRAADSAVYQAKEDGRDCVVIIPQTLQHHQLPANAERGS